jgi:L-ribulokinase
MQIYADVTGRRFRVSASSQASALGSAMFGAVAAGAAAGGYDPTPDAAARMAHLRADEYVPDPGHQAAYDDLFSEYVALHDYFGRGGNDVMKRLKAIRGRAMGSSSRVATAAGQP